MITIDADYSRIVFSKYYLVVKDECINFKNNESDPVVEIGNTNKVYLINNLENKLSSRAIWIYKFYIFIQTSGYEFVWCDKCKAEEKLIYILRADVYSLREIVLKSSLDHQVLSLKFICTNDSFEFNKI